MLTRRPPQRRLMPVRSAFDWFFQEPWQELTRWSEDTMPSIDMRETDDAYVIEAETPGVKPEDIEVTFEGSTLLIRGNYHRAKETDGEGRYIVKERETATYARAITIPGAVDASKISSSYENGELKITLPKAAEARARRIPISSGAKSSR